MIIKINIKKQKLNIKMAKYIQNEQSIKLE